MPVFYELTVNRRPVGAVYWTKDGDVCFYVGAVQGRRVGGRFGRRLDAMTAVEETYRDLRWGR